MALSTFGLTDIGAGAGLTANFKVQYEDSLPNQAAVIANANAVLAVVENEFTSTTSWFGTPHDKFGTGNRQVVNLNLTGGGNNSGYGSAINVDATTNAESCKMVFINEWVEILMSLSGGKWNAGNSDGEGLSQLCGILLFPVGHYRYYGSWVNQWLGSIRDPQYITSPEGTDKNPVSFGCALLFLNYLLAQLGFNISQIIQGGTGTLAGTYNNLTGLASNASTPFIQLVNQILPGTSTITTGNVDNPFPATFDGILLQIRGAGQIWVIYGNGRFPVPDAATLSRLFPGSTVFPYGDFLFAINTIPDDGTLLREESSPQVWIIQARTRVLAPPGVPGTVHVLWDGALAQIPLPNGILAGVVSDTNGAPVSDATVLITSTSFIPSGGGNSEQLSTDPQGRYSSSFLPPGVYGVSAIQDGFVPASASDTILDGVPITIQNFSLVRTSPFTITGQVTDGTGAPVVAALRLSVNSPIPEYITTKTDPAGNYSITLDPGTYNGDYTIDVTAVGFTSESRTITIPNGATITLNFALAKQGMLTGHVKDQRGPPLGGAKVTVGSSETFSDVAGAYSITVDSGLYAVTASAPGFTAINLSVQIPSGLAVTQDFVLSETIPGAITGTVFDDSDGAPRSGARVTALDTTLTTTDVNGNYTLTNLQPGPTQVVASFGTRYIPDKANVTVISGETVTQDFVLVRKGTTT